MGQISTPSPELDPEFHLWWTANAHLYFDSISIANAAWIASKETKAPS